jgi:hypothetical protein
VFGSGGWIRTIDLRVMSPTSCHCSTPRWRVHGPTLPAGIPPVPSALPRFTTRFGMGRGGTTALLAHHWFRGQWRGTFFGQFCICRFIPGHVFPQGSPRPCARVACTCRHASSSRRFPSHLLGDLPAYSRECTHLAVHFPLRCFQRFLLPDIATEPAGRPTTPPPAVRPIRSSRTKISSAQYTRRP